MTPNHRPTPAEQTEPTPEEFEEFVAAALRVDPKGLSGKHRKGRTNEECERAARCIPGGPRWARFRMTFNVHCKMGRSWEEVVDLATEDARQADPTFTPQGIDWERLRAI